VAVPLVANLGGHSTGCRYISPSSFTYSAIAVFIHEPEQLRTER
jgi:hypothetical protein